MTLALSVKMLTNDCGGETIKAVRIATVSAFVDEGWCINEALKEWG